MDISVSSYSNVGKRDNNEDAFSVRKRQNGILAIVADGLGGHAKGEVASALATKALPKLLAGKVPDPETLSQAICQVNNMILSAQGPEGPMKTTVAVVWICKKVCLAANVGDSRIYQFRNGQIVYQSVDHSLAQASVLSGDSSITDLRKHPDQNKLTRALGNAAPPKVDVHTLSLESGDRFLLCSDGFWGPIYEEEMLNAMADCRFPQPWLKKMKKRIIGANHPHQDNHTAIALTVQK